MFAKVNEARRSPQRTSEYRLVRPQSRPSKLCYCATRHPAYGQGRSDDEQKVPLRLIEIISPLHGAVVAAKVEVPLACHHPLPFSSCSNLREGLERLFSRMTYQPMQLSIASRRILSSTCWHTRLYPLQASVKSLIFCTVVEVSEECPNTTLLLQLSSFRRRNRSRDPRCFEVGAKPLMSQ